MNHSKEIPELNTRGQVPLVVALRTFAKRHSAPSCRIVAILNTRRLTSLDTQSIVDELEAVSNVENFGSILYRSVYPGIDEALLSYRTTPKCGDAH
jgi:hypothetical protein